MANEAPFPIDPALTGIAIKYKNAKHIADDVLPRVPVGIQTFKYKKYDLGEAFRIPDTHVGRKGRPNEVEFSHTEHSDTCVDNGLDDPIPQADIDNAPADYNPVSFAVQRLAELVSLSREKRVADVVFNANNYVAANKATLSGGSQWSDPTSDPLTALLTAMDGMIMRPNVVVLGQPTWSSLQTHPKLVKAYHGNSGDAGRITAEYLAQLLEVEQVLVGQSWAATSKEGQAVTTARLWGKFCAMLHINRDAQAGEMPTYGFTAQWGSKVAGSQVDPNIGLRGGVRVRTGESTKEVVCATDLGYLFSAAVA